MMQNETGSSDLDLLIAPEIKNDRLYKFIAWISAYTEAHHVIEIGSSAGSGSTEAFTAGLSVNRFKPQLYCVEVSKTRFAALEEKYRNLSFVHCYNMSSVSEAEFPSEQEIIQFYQTETSTLRQFALDEILRWYHQDIDYLRSSNVEVGAIDFIKKEHGIKQFDIALIDGSEFTGYAEFTKINGASIIILDDICAFKNWNVHKFLLSDPNYVLVLEDRNLRNGFSVFRRYDKKVSGFENGNLFKEKYKAAKNWWRRTWLAMSPPK